MRTRSTLTIFAMTSKALTLYRRATCQVIHACHQYPPPTNQFAPSLSFLLCQLFLHSHAACFYHLLEDPLHLRCVRIDSVISGILRTLYSGSFQQSMTLFHY